MRPGTQSWHERLWRTNNTADIARGAVPGAALFSAFGQRATAGASTDNVLWETGMPDALTVPDGIQLSFVSSGTDTRRLRMHYLDGDLLSREETITLAGTTPVLTAASDIRFVNDLYSLDNVAATTVTASSGGTTYARINAGDVQFNQALYRVPADQRLMLTALCAGAASGTAAARVTIKVEVSYFGGGDSFADQGILHPVGGIAAQDSAATLAFGPFAVPPGEIVALTFTCDKAAEVLGGLFGWTEGI